MSHTLVFLAVFAATFVLDYAWTRYISAVGQVRAHAAAFWSASMVPLAAINVLLYVQNPWVLIAAAAGAYSSTWLAVRREKQKASA